jgi:hypothetical protein
MRSSLTVVIAGLDPAIHVEVQHGVMFVISCLGRPIMDARVKPGHDAELLARLV